MRKFAQFLKPFLTETVQVFDLPGLAVAIVTSEGREYINFGNEKNGLPISEKTHFQIGSISKAFTHLGLAQLIPSYPDDYSITLTDLEVTPFHLITHGSGMAPLSGTMQSFLDFSEKDLIKSLPHHLRSEKPGEKFQYNNSTYWPVAKLIEQKGKKPWDQVISQEILEPLGMNATGYKTPKTKLTLPVVEKQGVNIILQDAPFINSILPAGGLWSTTEDLSLFAQFILAINNPLPMKADEFFCGFKAIYDFPDPVNKCGLDLVYTKKGYGLGHVTATPTFSETTMVNFVGATPGYSALVSCIPEHKVSIILLTNKMSQSQLLEYLAAKFLQYILEDKLELNLREIKKELDTYQQTLDQQLTFRLASHLPNSLQNLKIEINDLKYGAATLSSDKKEMHLVFANASKTLIFKYDELEKTLVCHNLNPHITEIFPKITLSVSQEKIIWYIWMNTRRGSLLELEKHEFSSIKF